MIGEEYKCAACKEVFEKVITEEESQKQLEKEFPGFSKGECEIVCDDCFWKMFKDEQ